MTRVAVWTTRCLRHIEGWFYHYPLLVSDWFGEQAFRLEKWHEKRLDGSGQ